MRPPSRRFIKTLENIASNPRHKMEDRLRAAQIVVEFLTTVTPKQEKKTVNPDNPEVETELIENLNEFIDPNF